MFTENKTTELKREYVDDIKNTAIAFANCDGGTLYVGIEDDGTVRGVDDADGTMLRVTNAIRDAVRPDLTMFLDCRCETMEGKPVICVRVQRGTARPYYLHSKGIRPEGVFVRQGASTVPASEAAILDMIKETSGDSYEAARSLEQRLTFEQASAFFRSRNVAFGPSQMRTLHLIGPDGTYTNLAFLLSDQCNHTVKLAVFEGSKKSVFKDRQELTGSLLQQLEDAYGYIDRFNRTRAEFSGLDRVDIRDYPPEAVREALSGTTRPRPCGRRYSTPWSTGTTPSAAPHSSVFLRIGSSSLPSAAWPGALGWRTSAWAYQCCVTLTWPTSSTACG